MVLATRVVYEVDAKLGKACQIKSESNWCGHKLETCKAYRLLTHRLRVWDLKSMGYIFVNIKFGKIDEIFEVVYTIHWYILFGQISMLNFIYLFWKVESRAWVYKEMKLKLN